MIYIANILNITRAHETNTMLDDYFRIFFLDIIENFRKSIESTINSYTTTRITLFVCFLVIIVFVYVFFWLPLVTKLLREVN